MKLFEAWIVGMCFTRAVLIGGIRKSSTRLHVRCAGALIVFSKEIIFYHIRLCSLFVLVFAKRLTPAFRLWGERSLKPCPPCLTYTPPTPHYFSCNPLEPQLFISGSIVTITYFQLKISSSYFANKMACVVGAVLIQASKILPLVIFSVAQHTKPEPLEDPRGRNAFRPILAEHWAESLHHWYMCAKPVIKA